MSWRIEKAKEIFDGILDGDTPVYNHANFEDVENEMEEIGRNWDDYEIETHINKTFLTKGYVWKEDENGDFYLLK